MTNLKIKTIFLSRIRECMAKFLWNYKNVLLSNLLDNLSKILHKKECLRVILNMKELDENFYYLMILYVKNIMKLLSLTKING